MTEHRSRPVAAVVDSGRCQQLVDLCCHGGVLKLDRDHPDHPDGRHYLEFAATGFRDFTRIASSHPAVWTDICLANKNSLLDLIGGLRTQLSELERILSEEDRAALYRYFAAAKQTRDEWLERQ